MTFVLGEIHLVFLCIKLTINLLKLYLSRETGLTTNEGYDLLGHYTLSYPRKLEWRGLRYQGRRDPQARARATALCF